MTVSAGGGPGFREPGRDENDAGAAHWPATDSGSVAATPPAEPVDLADALDALESMVEQYLYVDGIEHDHMFMSAGEEACEVLARLRPDKWELTKFGVRRRG